jgi:hypothetical protein
MKHYQHVSQEANQLLNQLIQSINSHSENTNLTVINPLGWSRRELIEISKKDHFSSTTLQTSWDDKQLLLVEIPSLGWTSINPQQMTPPQEVKEKKNDILTKY